QMTSDIESELASSLGNAGQAGGIDLGRRIQNEFKNVLLNTNKVTPELQLVADLVNDANTNFEELTFLLDAANIDITALSPATQKWLKLIERKTALVNLQALTDEFDKLRQPLDMGIEGAQFGFDLGTASV